MTIYDMNVLIDDKLETVQIQANNFRDAVKYTLIDYPKAVILKNNVSLQVWKETPRGTEYATHKFSFRDNELNKYWGHYITDVDKAIDDFIERVTS